VKDGAPLALRLQVSSTRAADCEPVAGASVDIWHCDASGVYSDVDDQRLATAGSQFLRGYQVTDADGSVAFTTIYPGSYPGRAVHIHFKIRTRGTSGRSFAFTSQLYFDDVLSDRVLARKPYARGDAQRTRNADDGLFSDGGSRLLLSVAGTPQGYAATFDVGLAMT
jgi:protocatechuate 3,4-dioxygenase beta subunit